MDPSCEAVPFGHAVDTADNVATPAPHAVSVNRYWSTSGCSRNVGCDEIRRTNVRHISAGTVANLLERGVESNNAKADNGRVQGEA